jgi:hypothetical protein
MKKSFQIMTALMAVLLLISVPAVQASSAHHHGHRHAHGEVEVELVLEANGRLSGHLKGAMDGFLPFEHVPKTDAQRKLVAELRSNLVKPNWLVSVNPEARCEQEAVRAVSPLFEGKGSGGHANLEVEFSLRCVNPEMIRALNFEVLSNSKRLKKVELEFVGPKGQAKAVLTTRKPQFLLP